MAGTPVLTPGGWTPIEELAEGAFVLSRDEHDPAAVSRRVLQTFARRVLQRFVRVSPVLNLHAGGQIIGTTGEHPFWAEGKGWVPAGALQIGDVLLSHDGQTVAVEGVADSGRVETVYNVEVDEHHTYFVGCQEWGFSVWAHNANQCGDGGNGSEKNKPGGNAQGAPKVMPGAEARSRRPTKRQVKEAATKLDELDGELNEARRALEDAKQDGDKPDTVEQIERDIAAIQLEREQAKQTLRLAGRPFRVESYPEHEGTGIPILTPGRK
ncbi:MAG: HINT domain-containing protein, partial [Gemmataceae bacterium]|nr:HINT domain-containing protein [Gemmataceae bacterium]